MVRLCFVLQTKGFMATARARSTWVAGGRAHARRDFATIQDIVSREADRDIGTMAEASGNAEHTR
jgi:hypothetical protein